MYLTNGSYEMMIPRGEPATPFLQIVEQLLQVSLGIISSHFCAHSLPL